MIARGARRKTGARMGHMAMNGPDGSIAAFASLSIARKVYRPHEQHQPGLGRGSPERAAVEAAGWTVAADGMEVEAMTAARGRSSRRG